MTDDRFREMLRVKTVALRSAMRRYDEAYWSDDDTKRIASDDMAGATWQLTVDRGRNQVSLLNRNNLRDAILLPDTARLLPRADWNLPLAIPGFEKGEVETFFSPKGCYPDAPKVTLADWHNEAVVDYRKQLSRLDLLNIMRDKDGAGGHIDKQPSDEVYNALVSGGAAEFSYRLRGERMGALFCRGKLAFFIIPEPLEDPGQELPPYTTEPRPLRYAATATVRQIAGELDYGLAELGL